ncbi:MAG TPA: isoprenylcysteine carboxylmethyltransferase family protein [Rhizomicrobium sp.]|nr:isoprenylcysteine carboxylmethyltransferase family protein [Rhizomicrobium sp.]
MVKFPPPIWLFIYLALAGAISALHSWRSLADLRLLPLGIALLVLGLALSAWAVVLFRREDTEINPTSVTNKKLVVRGPYAITRNPMYLGLTIVSIGIAFCVGSLPVFAVPLLMFATANWVHIPFEETKMRQQFGADFDDYTRRTRRWL